MLFNSIEFLLFLPIVFLLYWFVFRERRWQNLLIVTASYVFYGWWDWRFLILIAFTSFCSYWSGLLIGHYEKRRKAQRIVSAINIVLNLAILGIFKYFNFFAENFEALFLALGYQIDRITLDIILPVGISFYTFQALSYTIDVYRKQIQPTRDIVEFFAYISFFPQLVAGPIERATNLLPQFQQKRSFDYARAVDGLRQMLWGFMKKLMIADNCATVVNAHWSNYEHLSGLSLLVIGILFTFQIYCDFSGYSDIAIGCARLFGINLKRNFNVPYFSRNIPEFWRRWHISLMTWFRDYLYFPLGGSRCAKWKVIRNILIVWGVSGFWHGANWTFICWGLFHGIIISLYYLFGANTKYQNVVAAGRNFPNIKEVCQMGMTFLLVVIGLIIFRSESITQAFDYLQCMVTNDILPLTILDSYGKLYLGFCLLLMAVEWMQREKEHGLQFPDTPLFRLKRIRISIYLLIILLIITFTGKSQAFIYFQF
ncbi:MAG: MBOAT family protein [Prevotella sp.]|nr:MBOAT family protein [Prevotella sp.]